MTTYTTPSAHISHQPAQTPRFDAVDRAWRPLYRISATAALAVVLLTCTAVGFYLASPPPSTISGHFTQLQHNPLLGLLDLDLLMLAAYAVMMVLYLGLYIALRRASSSLMAIALALGLMNIAVYITTNPAFAMLSLSGQYATATAAEQRAAALAAGEAVYAISVGTAFDVSYILGGVCTLIFAAVMLRSGMFSKFTAYIGLATGVLMLIPATAGTIGLYLSLVSLVPMVIWLVLVARRLFQLADMTTPADVAA